MADFTSKALADSVMELLEEKSLDKISVKDIVNRCGVSRNTFYYHFDDIFDLLQWIIDTRAEEISRRINTTKQWKEGFLEALVFINDNKKIINHVYKSVNKLEVEKDLKNIATTYAYGLVSEFTGDGEYSEECISMVAEFYTDAALNSLLNWIDGGMKESPEMLATIYNELFTGTIQSALDSAERAYKAIKGQ